MPKTSEFYLKQLIEQVILYARQHYDAHLSVELFEKYIRTFYSQASYFDLEHRDIDQLYDIALMNWGLIFHRDQGDVNIDILNPVRSDARPDQPNTRIAIVCQDVPFLVDTIRMEINKLNISPLLIIHMGGIEVSRSSSSDLVDFQFSRKITKNIHIEAPIYVEIDYLSEDDFKHVEQRLQQVIADVLVTVRDWRPMSERMKETLQLIEKTQFHSHSLDVKESVAFLQWLIDDHFIFLGARDYSVVEQDGELCLQLNKGTGLGVLSDESQSKVLRQFSDLPKKALKQLLSQDHLLMISKSNTMSTVHRPGYTDYIGVKLFNDEGQLVGERRWVGLYTSTAYHSSPNEIPFLRGKVSAVLKRSGFRKNSHAQKDLVSILSMMPRDDLIQAPVNQLYHIAVGIFHMQERRQIRLFVREDNYGRFYSCMVYVPRDKFTTRLLNKIQAVLVERLNGIEVSFSTHFSVSVLVRIDFIVRINPKQTKKVKLRSIEKALVEVGKTWDDRLFEAIAVTPISGLSNKDARKYSAFFLGAYKERTSPGDALNDIVFLEKLNEKTTVLVDCQYKNFETPNQLTVKIFNLTSAIALSDAMPIFEHMGCRVLDEYLFECQSTNGDKVWISEFNVICNNLLDDVARSYFSDAFLHIWHKQCDDDAFNQLICLANLHWRQAALLRAFVKYVRQLGVAFSDDYMAKTLVGNPVITKLLFKLFELRFDPSIERSSEKLQNIEAQLYSSLDLVAVLDEDRIFRQLINLVLATSRTNYYSLNSQGNHKSYIVLKFNSRLITHMPQPQPECDIFVYSTEFEGIHLRTSKVARGGIRWSDRLQDYRVEVLGLMKAQQVKNPIIVPSGAKGGFVVKSSLLGLTREEINDVGVNCYKQFISGLLDVVDNMGDQQMSDPNQMICYDDNDEYLVVAADKGTAKFSDIANSISQQRGFWLGDAFASGGTTGYDHMAMGITARGVWVSAERHFSDLSINLAKDGISVIGIGDMSGDVFGNGLLMSDKIRLVAAFNHMDIFIDPNPNAKTSFKERKRLFKLPRSSWRDYNKKHISKGGGVFSRNQKSIEVTSQMKDVFGLSDATVTPIDLLRAILASRVDMIWNGGIGTFVKSSLEGNLQVGDFANDPIRIDGRDLNARIVCEGGNLGLTQLGRIEYEQFGGRLNTDFVDNSAGVDCSDHEVNTKILLDQVVAVGELTIEERNLLLQAMSDDVAALVLKNNYMQNQTISYVTHYSCQAMPVFIGYIKSLVSSGDLNPEIEYLPSFDEMEERYSSKKGFTRPEVSVLLAYTKIVLTNAILESDCCDDACYMDYLFRAFPKPLHDRYKHYIVNHPLKKQIIATQLSHALVSDVGVVFVYQLQTELNAKPIDIVKAYLAACHIFDVQSLRHNVRLLDGLIESKDQMNIGVKCFYLIDYAVRWLLRMTSLDEGVDAIVARYQPLVAKLKPQLPELLAGASLALYRKIQKELKALSLDHSLVDCFSSLLFMTHSLCIANCSQSFELDVSTVAKVYFEINDLFHLAHLRQAIVDFPVTDQWSFLIKAGFEQDLNTILQALTQSVLSVKGSDDGYCLQDWLVSRQQTLDGWQSKLQEYNHLKVKNFAAMSVLIRYLLEFANREFSFINGH